MARAEKLRSMEWLCQMVRFKRPSSVPFGGFPRSLFEPSLSEVSLGQKNSIIIPVVSDTHDVSTLISLFLSSEI